MTEEILQLPDKRNLSYALYGPGDGLPILYFHGTPSSRLEPSLVKAFGINLEELLAKYKLQLIAVDRPGMGLSSFNPAGDFMSFAEDVHILLQSLNIATARVVAWSGGGPFALATANRFPEVVQTVGIITGFTESFSKPGVFKALGGNKLYFGAAKRIPLILRFVLNIFLKRGATKPLPQRVSGLPDVDHTLLTDPRKMKVISETVFHESCRQGSKGAVYEAQLYFKDLGYELKDIRQPVHFWWGTSDKTVPKLHAEAVEQQAPHAVMHYKKDEGHLSIFIHYLQDALTTVAAE